MTGPEAQRIDAPLVRTAFVLVLGTFMATMDATIVTVGIDTLTEELGASIADVQWVTTAYLLAVVTAVPASGWLVDRFGGRRTWIGAVLVFLAGSALCALAWSPASLIAFRVLQGLGGGLLPPTGQTLLARAAGPGRIGRIISIVGVVPLLSPVFGPIIGGAILGVAHWSWLFSVNLPIGLVAVVLALRHVPRDAPAAAGAPLDLRGAALLSPGIAVLVFGLTGFAHGQAVPAAVSWGALALGAGILAGFVVHALRHRRDDGRRVPLLDLRLLSRPPFGAAALALLILGASVYGAMFLLPLYLQSGRGMTPWEAGLLLVPQGIGAVAGSVLVSRIVDRVAARTLVFTGVALVALGTVVFTQLASAPPAALIAGSLVVRGLGSSMISAPVMALVYSTLERTVIPRASSALNLLSTIGGSVGTALLAVILQTRLAAREPLGAAGVTWAFADAFWWVLGFCVVALLGVSRLPRRSLRERRAAQQGR
ncbi:DHA2 family efflux MFS transporter permease subunit [Pseudonocardia sp. MH-G8]|uniref:DHA2 family efflux MFS transporter permease subunit n=1 Tax=Pseudonocardia sp. MH-G8 TaxID=1854588 RepID=UPI000BA12EC6|nr:DHA2 family efflux MFS transporter permease subunit [Pseudonocardia sp. MH-G8]OZM81024.1 MFS transporter [Pseudonocardia sp. MH-G8]